MYDRIHKYSDFKYLFIYVKIDFSYCILSEQKTTQNLRGLSNNQTKLKFIKSNNCFQLLIWW